MRKDAKLPAGNPKVMLQQDLDIKGVYTFPNRFSQTPQGALEIALNCVIDAPGAVESRRGNVRYGTYATDVPLQTLSMTEFRNTIVTHTSSQKIFKDNGGSFTAFSGTYSVPNVLDPESRVRFINLNQNLYFTSGGGVFRLDSITGQPILAGAPAGLGGVGVTTGTSGWMANNVNVAYRILWLFIDANGNLIRGAPSDRIIVPNNSGGTRNTITTWTVPTDVSTGWTYQLYRGNVSTSLATEPDDNMQLVFQGQPTAGEISSRQLNITDITPDVLKGTVLYTSAEGIQNANSRPPFAADIELYKGLACYANCKSSQTFFLTLISGSLLANGNTLTFTRGATSFTITAGAAENTATGTFLNYTAGTPSENISRTANSIVRVINLYAANTFLNAYYSSGFSESPGKMTLIDRTLNTNSFTVTCNNTATIFSPQLPSSGSTSSNTSTNSSQPNAIFFSKSLQPDAVPLVNFVTVGTSSAPIVRIVSLRDSLVVFKTDGIYRITGTALSNFTVQPLDVQMRIKAVNSVAVLNNMVYAFVDQGIVRIQDSGGIEIKSLPIERELLTLASDNFPGFEGATYAVSYPADHKYILNTVTTESDTYATRAYVYNYITDAWTTWGTSFTAGFVRASDGRLYQATYDVTGSKVYQERKTFTLQDYADDEYDITITGVTTVGDISTITYTGVTPLPGQTLVQVTGTGTVYSIVESVNLGSFTVPKAAFQVGTAKLYTPIDVRFEIAPMYGDTPNAMKQFPEVSLLLDSDSFSSLSIAFSSDQALGTAVAQGISNITNGPWGQFPWGLAAWGSLAQESQRVRIFVPAAAQKANWITLTISLRQAFKRMRTSGITIAFRPLTVRMR